MLASATQPAREPREPARDPARDPAREPEQGCQARAHIKFPQSGCPSLDFDRETPGGFSFSTAFDFEEGRSVAGRDESARGPSDRNSGRLPSASILHGGARRC